MTKACTQCGKCCTNSNYMGSLRATGEDLLRWRREGRWDILQWCGVLGKADNPLAVLWVHPDTGVEKKRCPFVRKIPRTNKYNCRIYDTRPQVCHDYVPFASGSICE